MVHEKSFDDIPEASPIRRCTECNRLSFNRVSCPVCGGDMKEEPLLAENVAEAERLTYAGRSWPALKESKSFDTQRLNESPLFKEIGRLW